jgi:hypothetical protein
MLLRFLALHCTKAGDQTDNPIQEEEEEDKRGKA